MPDGSSICSGNIGNGNGLERHPNFVQEPQLLPPVTISNKKRHEILIAHSQKGWVREILGDGDGRRGGEKLPEMAVPGRSDIGGTDRVVTVSDIKRETKFKSELFSGCSQDEACLGVGMDLLEESGDVLDLLGEIGMLDTKTLVFGGTK